MKVTKANIQEIDDHFSGGLSQWLKRNSNFIKADPWSKKALHIASWQLFETYKNGNPEALEFLSSVLACKTSEPCYQILCPMCRVKKQSAVSKKAQEAFSLFNPTEIGFATILLPLHKTGDGVIDEIQSFRHALKVQLIRHRRELDDSGPFKMCGAFEVDIKRYGTHMDLSKRSRLLVEELGFDTKYMKSQFLPHLHAIVAPLNKHTEPVWDECITNALGGSLLPYQMLVRSLHTNKTRDENVDRMSRYMYKARLQYSENILTDNPSQKNVRYTRPYIGNELVNYLKCIDQVKNFRGLKFEYNM